MDGRNGYGSQRTALSAPSIAELLLRAKGMHLYRKVLDDKIGGAFLELLGHLAAEMRESSRAKLFESYSRLFSLLAAETELSSSLPVGDAWQDHLLNRLLADENPFSLKASRVSPEAMGPSMVTAVRNDLTVMQRLFGLDGATVASLIEPALGGEGMAVVSWQDLRPMPMESSTPAVDVPAVKLLLAASDDWPSLLGEVAEHYHSAGVGDLARFRAFRWARAESGGRLEGIPHPDPIRLENLVEYDAERALLIQNTEQFVKGYTANNALLYGERGTGKSSTVKALLQEYGNQGLRLVEVPKAFLSDFGRILSLLRGRPERFIIFVDDLSFDEKETAYKDLKAVLEGSLESRPDNILVYATSNRRHLVQERFSDREQVGDGEVRKRDTHEEKLSLADRFGITVVFSSPDQPKFLRIVESLVAQRGLTIDPEELKARAIRWAAWQGGLSGRSARQFVDHLTGELGLRKQTAGA